MSLLRNKIAKTISLVGLFALFYAISEPLKINFDKKILGKKEKSEKGLIKSKNTNIQNNSKNKIPVLKLYIPNESQKKLDKKEADAMALGGYLFNSKDDYVKAYINTDFGTKKCKIRLKGDWAVDHFQSKFSSLRIRVKKGSFEGLKDFTIQNPKTRNGYYGILLYSLLRKYKIFSIIQKPIKVKINDEYKGIALMESHFSDSNIFEINKRRPGIIFKSYEDFLWKQRAANKKSGVHIFDQKKISRSNRFLNQFLGNHPDFSNMIWGYDFQYNYNNTPYRAYNEKEIFENPNLNKDHWRALSLMRGYQEGLIKNEEVFDMHKLAYYVAISNLFSVWHGFALSNFKVYWNPYNEKFEPVSFDNFVPDVHDFQFNQPFFFRALTSQIFLNEYKKAIIELQKNIDQIISDLRSEEKKLIGQLEINNVNENKINLYWKNFKKKMFYLSNNVPSLSRESQTMEHFESPEMNKNAYVNDPMVFYRIGEDVEIVNTINKRIRIIGITKKNEDKENILPRHIEVPSSRSKLGKAYLRGAGAFGNRKFWVDYKYDNKLYRKQFKIINYVYPQKKSASCKKLPLPSFIEIEGPNLYSIKPGEWSVEKTICLFDSYSILKINAGTKLNFAKNTMLKLNGDLIVNGAKNNPVIFTAKKRWKGILVVNSTKSNIRDVKISKGQVLNNYPYSGFINFFRSKVVFENVEIDDVDAEDTINLISSTFNINSVKINKVRSDAIDFDFSNGIVTNSRFENIGGDALDFSNANAQVSRTSFENVEDKAISAGEESVISVSKINAKDVDTAVASKDGSQVTFNASKVEKTKNGVLVYRKKGLYTGASLLAKNIQFLGVDHNGLCLIGSNLSLNNKSVVCDLVKLYDSYDMSKVK